MVTSRTHQMNSKTQLVFVCYTADRFERMQWINDLILYCDPDPCSLPLKLLFHSTNRSVRGYSNDVRKHFVDEFHFRWDEIAKIRREWNQSIRCVERNTTVTDIVSSWLENASADGSFSNVTRWFAAAVDRGITDSAAGKLLQKHLSHKFSAQKCHHVT